LKFIILVLCFFIISCSSTSSKKTEKLNTELQNNGQIKSEIESNGNYSIYKKSLDGSDYYLRNKKFKLAKIFLNRAIKENPRDFPLSQNLENIKKTHQEFLKKLWEESLIEESYGSIFCSTCALDKWYLILDQGEDYAELSNKAIEKILKYDKFTP
jgi:hypothetical protein